MGGLNPWDQRANLLEQTTYPINQYLFPAAGGKGHLPAWCRYSIPGRGPGYKRDFLAKADSDSPLWYSEAGFTEVFSLPVDSFRQSIGMQVKPTARLCFHDLLFIGGLFEKAYRKTVFFNRKGLPARGQINGSTVPRGDGSEFSRFQVKDSIEQGKVLPGHGIHRGKPVQLLANFSGGHNLESGPFVLKPGQ